MAANSVACNLHGFAVRMRARAYFHSYPMVLLLLQWPSTGAAAPWRAFETHYHLSSVERSDADRGPSSWGLGRRAAHSSSTCPQLMPCRSIPSSLKVEHMTCASSLCHGKQRVSKCAMAPPLLAESRARGGRTPVERLAHELVHEAILAQLS